MNNINNIPINTTSVKYPHRVQYYEFTLLFPSMTCGFRQTVWNLVATDQRHYIQVLTTVLSAVRLAVNQSQ